MIVGAITGSTVGVPVALVTVPAVLLTATVNVDPLSAVTAALNRPVPSVATNSVADTKTPDSARRSHNRCILRIDPLAGS